MRYEEVVADAGYESLENYLYLEQNGQMCFIKPANYDQKKTSKFRKQVGRIENMEYDPEEDCFTCVQGRKLQNMTTKKTVLPVYRAGSCT